VLGDLVDDLLAGRTIEDGRAMLVSLHFGALESVVENVVVDPVAWPKTFVGGDQGRSRRRSHHIPVARARSGPALRVGIGSRCD
jgi:hypothetical protein